MKKLTVPIAKALANQVISKVNAEKSNVLKKVKEDYKKSKEWEAYLKADAILQKAREARELVEGDLKDKFNTSDYYISSIYNRDEGGPYASFSIARTNLDVEEIKDRILVEHYKAEETGETSEELINRMVKDLIS